MTTTDDAGQHREPQESQESQATQVSPGKEQPQRRTPRPPGSVNMAASARMRLTAAAHAQGEETEYVLTRYALQRLLYRLSQSAHADTFILKGAFLFILWEGQPHRATRDLDLLGFGSAQASHIADVFRDLCALPVADDGLVYLPETVQARPIREHQEYGGIRVLLHVVEELRRFLLPPIAALANGDVFDHQWAPAHGSWNATEPSQPSETVDS